MSIPTFQLIRSRRKSLSIEITAQTTLIVRAPLRMSVAVIEQFILSKLDWIETKQQLLRQQALQATARQDEYLYLGTSYQLIPISHPIAPIVLKEQTLYISEQGLAHKQELLLRWYKTQAMHIFQERMAILSNRAGIWPNKLRLSTATKRWGSCNSKGLISLNWRLVMAPLNVIDYVIVHELAHIVEMNHSPRFWHLVAKIMPEYKTARQWLKINGHQLALS